MPIKTLSSKPKVSPLLPAAHPVAGKMARRGLVIKASPSSSSPVVEEDSVGLLERCFMAPPAAIISPVMKGEYGSLGAVTLEKGKLDMSQKQAKSSPEVCFFFYLKNFFMR